MIQFKNYSGMRQPDFFVKIFVDAVNYLVPDCNTEIEFHNLEDSDNKYRDIVARLGNKIFLSQSEIGKIGFTDVELYAAIAHELGHIFYGSKSHTADSEQRADTFAADLGLGEIMVQVIDKIIISRRYRDRVGSLVRRIQYLSACTADSVRI